MVTTRLSAYAVLLGTLCLWPMLAQGQSQADAAQGTTAQDRCTDLDGNAVPCPPEVERQTPQVAASAVSRRRRGQPPANIDDLPYRSAADMGSAEVPLDSWVYPAFDRLAALGYAPTAFAGLRPWTRLECARLVREAGEQIDPEGHREAKSLYDALAAEFADESSRIEWGFNREARIDSIYTRTVGLAGPALNQSYYFGSSIVNDYGRPYAEGFNAVSGISAEAARGPLAFYIRGEYQHAPSAPGLPPAAQQAISQDYWHDEVPPTGAPTPEINRVRLLDAYGALQKSNWQFSFGRQSLWWGPGASGPLIYSDNAAPITMFRISQVSPGRLPFPFSYLGPVRSEFFVGRLQGQTVVNVGGGNRVGTPGVPLSDQPFVHGEKFSFKPTENLEFGVSRTGVFGGPGFPITVHRLLGVFFSFGNSFGSADPGDRRAGFDFSYHVPYLRKWLVLYNDSMSEDEMSPIGYPRRSAMNPGIYLPQIPKLNKLDFRAESVYTDLPGLIPQGFYYFNVRYLDGYTNQGNILGSWVGREGRGLELSSTYWFSPRNTLQFEYRGQLVNPQFLKGGSLDGFAVKTDFMLRPEISLTSSLEYQRWNFPVLANGAQSLLISTVQLTYWPKW
jgi:hypothetical protein